MTLSHARLTELLYYDPWTGFFFWRVNDGKKRRGNPAGSVNKITGYVEIRIDGHLYYGHRLAVFYEGGKWPEDQVDHRDTNRSNNARWNLRPATRHQNARNQARRKSNTTGFKGVYLDQRRGTFVAEIVSNRRRLHLGSYEDPKDAARAYDAAAIEYHGQFAKTNQELGLL